MRPHGQGQPAACRLPVRRADTRCRRRAAQVPGDVVEIKAGQRVPADCRLLEASRDLRVEMGTIGYRASDGGGPGHARDNLEVACRALAPPRNAHLGPMRTSHARFWGWQADETVGPWECKNLVFMGCMCERGSGRGLVIKTGMHSALGVIAREMEWAQPLEAAPLHQKLSSLETAFEAQTEVRALALPAPSNAPACPSPCRLKARPLSSLYARARLLRRAGPRACQPPRCKWAS